MFQWHIELHAHTVNEILPGVLALIVQLLQLEDDPLGRLLPEIQLHVGEEELYFGIHPFWVLDEQLYNRAPHLKGSTESWPAGGKGSEWGDRSEHR